MNVAARFCRQCGTLINSGASFCQNCGLPISAGNPNPQSIQPPPSAAVNYPQPAPVAAVTRQRPSILLIVVGLLLMVVALRAPAALIFGISTSCVIQDVRQIIDQSSERMDYNYRITYSFTTPDGKGHTGSYDMNRVYNSSNLPAEGSLKSVKYLPGIPFVNSIAGQSNIGLASIFLLLLGIGLLIIGLKGGGSISFRRTRH